jgi:phospholipase C
MPIDMSLVKTLVVVMMENRSFDNLLGYLSLEPYKRNNVEGISVAPAWLDRVASVYKGMKYRPFVLTDPYDAIDADPPHERNQIEIQMGISVNGTFPMNGFVTNYASAKGTKLPTAGSEPPVMGYFTADQAPVTDFFAQNFAICDRWFYSLPAGTQPNRLMAMGGFSTIDVNQVPLPNQELVYDWLTRNGIRWRVYHEGLPFFTLMPCWISDILMEEHFRPLRNFTMTFKTNLPMNFLKSSSLNRPIRMHLTSAGAAMIMHLQPSRVDRNFYWKHIAA